jgi:8-oxo-dGTP pyrophosphatase MutT (NUDIX family)
MIETSDKVEPVHPSATVVLVRDGSDSIETLLLQRNKALRHMGGMWVFPGGRIDEADRPPSGDDYEAALNAAIRETREEAGLELDRDQLVYFAHWTTPEGARKRFATWFFLAILEDDQEVVVDGSEIAHHQWMTPERALAELADQDNPFRIMPPTFVSLVDLQPFACCCDARAAMDERDAIIYEPRMVFVEDGICFLYQGDAGYEKQEIQPEGPEHRVYMVNDQLEYIRRL